MGTNKRLKDLEDKVLGKPEVGSTRFCMCGLPEAEQVLLESARKYALMEIPFEEVSEAQKTVMSEASKLLHFRIFDLFTGYLEGLLCREDKIARIVLHERFLWFIRELIKEIQQQLDVSEIEKNTPEDCEVDRVDEYFRKAPELYTPDSYDKISTEITLGMMKGKIRTFAEPNAVTTEKDLIESSKKGGTVNHE